MQRRVIPGGLAAVALVGLALAEGACTGGLEAVLAALADECALTSDCQEGLVCVFERCHEACKVSADCSPTPSGDAPRCMLGPTKDHYCQLDDETGCTYNSECPDEQVCGRDAECRDQCETDKDCVTDEVCVTRSCALEDELDANGQLPIATSSTAPGEGATCNYDSECVDFDPSFVCRFNACQFECKGAVDCPTHVCEIPAGSEGGRCATLTESCVPGSLYPCCIPGAQVACACLGETQGVQVCVADGKGYGPCEDDTGDCGAP